MTEIRRHDLRFTIDETTQFLKQVLGARADEASVRPRGKDGGLGDRIAAGGAVFTPSRERQAGVSPYLVKPILEWAKGERRLLVATGLTSIGVNIVAGDQYKAIVLPSRMYREPYQEKGLTPEREIQEMSGEADFRGVGGHRVGPTAREAVVRRG